MLFDVYMHTDLFRLYRDEGQSCTVAFLKYDTENAKHVSKRGVSEGAKLWRVFVSRVGEQQIFLIACNWGFCAESACLLNM